MHISLKRTKKRQKTIRFTQIEHSIHTMNRKKLDFLVIHVFLGILGFLGQKRVSRLSVFPPLFALIAFGTLEVLTTRVDTLKCNTYAN